MAQPQFYFKNNKSLLKELSDKDIESAIELYEQKEAFEDILLQFNIKAEGKKVNFYKHLPYKRSAVKCFCGAYLYFKIPARSIQARQLFTCLSCGHCEVPWCQCVTCKQNRNLYREGGMKEFFTRMTEHLFPEEKVYNDSFEEFEENTTAFK